VIKFKLGIWVFAIQEKKKKKKEYWYRPHFQFFGTKWPRESSLATLLAFGQTKFSY